MNDIVYIVVYFNGNEYKKRIVNLECKRVASQLAKTKSMLTGKSSYVLKSRGVWIDGIFNSIESTHVCSYRDGKRS